MTERQHWLFVGIVLGLVVFASSLFGAYMALGEYGLAALQCVCALVNGMTLIRRYDAYAIERGAV
jgi:tetrahydromethanopterin S-methyltransferase subunit C